MLKKFTMLLLALIIMAGMSLSTGLAAEKAGAQHREFPYAYESAGAAARAEVPPDAIFQGVLDDKDMVTFSFYDNNTLRAYEAVVLKSVNAVQEVKISGSNLPGSTTVTKTPQDIEAIVLKAYPDAKNLEIALKKEGNLSYYEAEFATAKFSKADIKINPVTGAFGSQKLQYKVDAPPVKEVQPVNDPPQAKEEQPAVKQNPVPPVPSEWMCGNCGTLNHEGQFCTNCGTRRPAEMSAPAVKCSKCGWASADPYNLPNFCPECGSPFQQ